MRQKIKEIFNKLIASFNTTKDGFSARKLSAFTVVVLICIVHAKWINSDRWEYLAEILALDYMFVLTLLVFTTWQYVNYPTPKGEELQGSALQLMSAVRPDF